MEESGNLTSVDVCAVRVLLVVLLRWFLVQLELLS